MRQAKHLECEAECLPPSATCIEVADLMDRKSVGTVVIVDRARVPLGIVTDRDLSSRVVSAGRDPLKTNAEDVMSRDIAVADRKESLTSLLEQMKSRAIRRIPVVEEGMLVGMISLDDLTLDISSHLFQISEAPSIQIRESRRETRARRRREALDAAVDELRHQISHTGDRVRDQLTDSLEDLANRIRDRR